MRVIALLLITVRLFGASWSVVCAARGEMQIAPAMLGNIYFKTVTIVDGTPLLPLNLPASHPARKAFMEQVLRSDFETWDTYYDAMHFQGVQAPHVVPSPEAMKRYLLRIEGSVGYLPTRQVEAPLVELKRFSF